jgi:hypothetical protein
MSQAIGPKIPFRCSYDCEQMGYPGHTVREIFDRSSDSYRFQVDENRFFVFDENCFAALLNAHEANKDR